MRIIYASVFIATLLLGWLFLAWFGDFNMYVIFPSGQTMLKGLATPRERVMLGFLLAIPLAALDTAMVWLVARLQHRPAKGSDPSTQQDAFTVK